MPVLFKLVGYLDYEIIDKFSGNINLLNIHKLFISWGLSDEEVVQIKFIIDSEQVRDETKLYTINENEIHKIFIFIFNQETRKKLQIIFNTYGVEASYSNQSDKFTDQLIKVEEECNNKLTPEIINKVNENTLILLADPDFVNLLNIYKKKPYLFNLLSNYIQNNKSSEIFYSEINIDDLSQDKILYYNDLTLKIMNLNLGFTPENIMDSLIKYSGHLNIAIRSLFNNTSTSISS